VSANSLDADVKAVSVMIVDELTPDRADPEGSDNTKESLYSTGIDPVVAAIALKVVLGIAASFLGRLFYDRWKSARTRKHLESLADEVAGRLKGELPKVEPIDSDKVRADVLAVLTLEGLTEAQANAVFDKAIAVVSDKFRR
jgi:hypothetical protein